MFEPLLTTGLALLALRPAALAMPSAPLLPLTFPHSPWCSLLPRYLDGVTLSGHAKYPPWLLLCTLDGCLSFLPDASHVQSYTPILHLSASLASSHTDPTSLRDLQVASP